MQRARQLYIYVIATVSLFFFAWGVSLLLDAAIEAVSRAVGDDVLSSGGSLESQLSQALAMTLVAGPVWLVHWWLVERGSHGQDRSSTPRALFLMVGLAVPMLVVRGRVVSLADWLWGVLLSAQDVHWEDTRSGLAVIIVGLLVWGLYLWTQHRDVTAGSLPPSAQWPPRLAFYGLLGLGLGMALTGIVGVVSLPIDELIGETVLIGENVWRSELAASLARLTVGAVLWGGIWWLLSHRLDDAGWLGASERQSTLRRIYLYAATAVGILLTLRGLSGALQEPLRQALDVSSAGSTRASLELTVLPLSNALAGAVTWLFHRNQFQLEAERYSETGEQAGVRRFYRYLVLLAGLAIGAVGLAWLLGTTFDVLFSGEPAIDLDDDWWRRDFAQFIPLAAVGAVLWLVQWRHVERDLQADPEAERDAVSRRIYLYIAVGASLIAGLVTLGVMVFRLFEWALGVSDSETSASGTWMATGVFIVALLVVVFHGLALRDDLAAQELAEAGEEERLLRLTGPAGSDLDNVIDQLGQHLPPGVRIERR